MSVVGRSAPAPLTCMHPITEMEGSVSNGFDQMKGISFLGRLAEGEPPREGAIVHYAGVCGEIDITSDFHSRKWFRTSYLRSTLSSPLLPLLD